MKFCQRVGKYYVSVLGMLINKKSIVSIEYTRFNNTFVPGISVVTVFYNDVQKRTKYFEVCDEDDSKILKFKKELEESIK